MPRIPGSWAVIFRFMRAARNEIWSQLPPKCNSCGDSIT